MSEEYLKRHSLDKDNDKDERLLVESIANIENVHKCEKKIINN